MNDKEYFENKAIELLREYFGMQNFVNLDKPDLQNITDNIGVEVRRAIDTEDGKREGYVNANFTSQKPLEEKNEQLEKRKIMGKVLDLGFAHVLIPETYGSTSFIKEGYKKIVDSFFDKLSKLNGGGYTHFSTNALFLFCEHANEQWEIGMIINDINANLRTKKNESDIMFDVIFFDTIQHLHKVEYIEVEKKYKVIETKDKSPLS